MELIFHEDVLNLGDKPYEFKEFFPTQGFLEDGITLANFHTAIAKFGGPLAILMNRQVMMLEPKDKSLKEDVCFFSSEGKKIHSVHIDYIDDIIGFDFITNELLLIVTKAPSFFLIDPFQKTTQPLPYLLDPKFKGTIHSVRIFRNSFAFCAKAFTSSVVEEMKFYYVENVHQISNTSSQNVQEKSFAKSGLKESPRDWIVIPSDQSALNVLELQIAHPECGIISLTETQAQQYYQQLTDSQQQQQTQKQQPKQQQPQTLPAIRNIQFIAMAPSSSLIAYLQEVGDKKIKLCVVSNDYEASTYKVSDVDLKEFKLPVSVGSNSKAASQLKMLWCGDHCCILSGDKSFLMIGPNVSEDVKLQEDFALSTEIDGLRVFMKSSSKMLRLLPSSYLNTYPNTYLKYSENISSAAQLLQNYQNLKNKQPFDDSNLRGNINELKSAVQECMIAAEFTNEEEKQQDLLKAASYGKTYIGADSNQHDYFGHLCLKLRVAYNFREQKTRRMITCAQITHLLSGELQQQLINIMLRYDYHGLAINVCSQLDFKQKVRTHIFEHWAERVIEKSSQNFRKELKAQTEQGAEDPPGLTRSFSNSFNILNNEDDRVAQKIINKLTKEKNIQFVNISKRAMKEGRQRLASVLLQQETSAFKRVPVLIWMGKNCDEFERASVKLTSISKDILKQRTQSQEWQLNVELKQKEIFQKALEQALNSHDSELIYVCLKEMDNTIKNNKLKFEVIKSKSIFINHYKNYLKNSLDPKKQSRYLDFLKELDITISSNGKPSTEIGLEKGLYLMKKAMTVQPNLNLDDNLKEKQINLDLALQSMDKSMDDKFYIEMVKNEIEALKVTLISLRSASKEELKDIDMYGINNWTVNESLLRMVRYEKDFDKRVKIFQVPIKIVEALRVRYLIQEKTMEALDSLMTDVNKKNVIIPFEMVAAKLIQIGEKEAAVRLILQIPKMEERVTILLKVDEAKKAAKTVLDSKKNLELLQMIKDSCRDADVLNYIDSQLANRR